VRRSARQWSAAMVVAVFALVGCSNDKQVQQITTLQIIAPDYVCWAFHQPTGPTDSALNKEIVGCGDQVVPLRDLDSVTVVKAKPVDSGFLSAVLIVNGIQVDAKSLHGDVTSVTLTREG